MNEQSKIVLGVDGGGTSTTAWVANLDGEILGKGVSGPSNIKAVGEEAGFNALSEAIQMALADSACELNLFAASCLGLAGFGRTEDQLLLNQWMDRQTMGFGQRLLATDGDLVLAAGTPDGWGVALIAGTGSIAVGRSKDGRQARAGGWGHWIGDEGSAYRVVVDALKLIAMRHDGRMILVSKHDCLRDSLLEALGLESAEGLPSVIHQGEWDRTRLASLAPLVLQCAASDYEIESRILRPAGEDLGEMALAVGRVLGLFSEPLPLALAGSFLLNAETVLKFLLDLVRTHGGDPKVQFVREPVAGAVKLAIASLRENGS